MSDIRNLALQGLSIEQLRGLTKKHFGEAPDGTSLESLDRDQLIETLSSRAALDPKLAETLKAYEIAFRPTFYVMALSRKGRQQPVIDRASLQKVIKIINENARKQAESGPPSTKGFKDEDVVEHEGGVVELYLTWRRIHHYWKPGKITRKHLYEARFGIVILDFAADKALLACNTKKERYADARLSGCPVAVQLSPPRSYRPGNGRYGLLDRRRRLPPVSTIFQRKGIPHLRVHPTREELNLKAVTHPITGMAVAVAEPLARLQLVPTEKLLFTITEALQHAATQFAALKEVVWTPFHIRANVLYLDVQRALGTPTTHRLGIEVAPDDVKEFQKPMQRTVAPAAWEGLRDQLRALGEKCRHMEDHTCTSCVSDKRFLCLRSLTGRFLMRPFILAHKGIELSDLQADLHVGDERLHVFGFAKQSSSKTSGLTARNKNGAILLVQVLMQVERQALDTVVIISPSTINEDLRERLQVVCGVFGKRLLILDEVALAKLYLAFEGYARYVGISVEEMIRASSKESQRAA